MFERFTREARACVVTARERAGSEGAPAVGEQHLLAALLDMPRVRGLIQVDGRAVDDIVRDVQVALHHGGLRREEIDALTGAGIDVDAVGARLRAWQQHDARPGPAARRLGRGVGFTTGAKATLQQALRQATARRDRSLGSEHILLGLLDGSGPVADVLGDHGVTAASVHVALDQRRAA